ncbi:putative potassium transport system protein kup [Parapedobacter pyrenivorans]|uniref:Probable potassium transport system protein Kup n=1 Tax=Parapedobacter pyrenivorans TaxID=1305674 RepID=A0A917HWG7_9SPHI|nr:KUP/HAK/KT family potassium transporter [Parapedobacter pyrenivorans]GGG94600.1 putative potassium transport system protein kup [Parapedobacter pyrenivorans]
MQQQSAKHPLTAAGLLIALGIIYGDIGTSPLYVFKAIIGQDSINPELVYGGLSCIFWTLTLQTTIKYVIITLRADNKGEGGILSLFSLVRKRGKWIVFPAMLGGAALLADGMITPAITISSAIEGLDIFYPQLQTVPIVLVIVVALFSLQRFGTAVVGRLFGPVMLIWFSMLAILGLAHLLGNPAVLMAISPHYAVQTIASHPNSLLIIGAVFLCTTGAEALYSDLGHCGLKNIRISWIFVKACLLCNYFGQGAWLLEHDGALLSGSNPFYMVMPKWFIPYGISVATLAAVIASQAMISGAFTLVSEAVRLNLWPKVRIVHPNLLKGQLYVPSANWILLIGCIIVILVFRESAKMEAAYGLAINISFIVTTVLMTVFLLQKRVPKIFAFSFLVVYLAIELTFFVGNVSKFTHGGWLTLLITAIIFSLMLCWWWARKIKNRHTRFVDIGKYTAIISEIGKDKSIPLYSSQLVYLTSANFDFEIEESIIYSIVKKKPKRADVYWLVHVDVTDSPYTGEYEITQLIPGRLIRIDFRLGFRDEQRISVLFREVVENLVANGEVDIKSNFDTLRKHGIDGDFRFIVLERILSNSSEFNFAERIVLDIYSALKVFSLSEERGFGLDSSFVTIERVPLMVPSSFRKKEQLRRTK